MDSHYKIMYNNKNEFSFIVLLMKSIIFSYVLINYKNNVIFKVVIV